MATLIPFPGFPIKQFQGSNIPNPPRLANGRSEADLNVLEFLTKHTEPTQKIRIESRLIGPNSSPSAHARQL